MKREYWDGMKMDGIKNRASELDCLISREFLNTGDLKDEVSRFIKKTCE